MLLEYTRRSFKLRILNIINMKAIDEDDFKKKREDFSTNIRKTNRQNLLMKRRNIDFNEDLMITNEKNTLKTNLLILDQSMRTYLTEIMKRTYNQGDLKQIFTLMGSKDIIDRHRAAYALRQLSLDDNLGPKISQNLQDQALDLIISWYTQQAYIQLKFEALWIITNLISHSAEACTKIVQRNVLIQISTDLLNDFDNIKFRAIWAVGNIAADNSKYRDQLIANGSIIKIIKYLQGERNSQQIVTSIWALTNLARGKPAPKYDSVKHVIPSIAEALKKKLIRNSKIQSDCLWAIANLSEGPKIRLQRIVQTGVLPCVMGYLKSSDLKLSVPALRIVGNLTSGSKEHTNEVLKNNFLDEALTLLVSSKSFIVKQTCWALSNITAGTDQQILQFLQRVDLIHKLIQIYPQQSNENKTEIVWIFSNLERSDIPEVIQKFMEDLGLIKMIGQLLKQNQQKCIVDALTCLNRILVMGDKCVQKSDQNNRLAEDFIRLGYLPVLQNLYNNHQSEAIERESKKILDRFFNTGDSPSQMRDD